MVLLLRCLFGSPFEGVSVWSALLVVVFAAYTILTLVSQGWSHSPGLALEAFNQTQLYLLVLVVMVVGGP